MLPGAPIGPDISEDRTRTVYDHIPKLHELLPNAGWPGVTYAQVCVHNIKHASDRVEKPANLRPIRGTSYYSISGPLGEAQMALVGCGKPIHGAAPEGGARVCYTDGEVSKLTGIKVASAIWFRKHLEMEPEVLEEDEIDVEVAPVTKDKRKPTPCGELKDPRGHRMHIMKCRKCQEITYGNVPSAP